MIDRKYKINAFTKSELTESLLWPIILDDLYAICGVTLIFSLPLDMEDELNLILCVTLKRLICFQLTRQVGALLSTSVWVDFPFCKNH